MNLILCHTTVDFDAFGAAVGLSRLVPGARIVLAGGAHPPVRDFLALYRDEFALIERRAVTPEKINTIYIVDTQLRDRLGKTAEWLDLPQVQVVIYDHHPLAQTDIACQERHAEAVGATTTLMVEQLQAAQVQLTVPEATVMALGIHVDTGSLTYDHTTPRDGMALAWLMQQVANLEVVAAYVNPGLSRGLLELLGEALVGVETVTIEGYDVAWVLLQTPDYLPGLSSLASRLMALTDSDALLLGHGYQRGEGQVLTVIGRSRIPETDLNQLFQPLGGGGHRSAAALTLHQVEMESTLEALVSGLQAQIPVALTARELMSSPVRTIRPETTISEAQRILLRYGHSGLSVVDQDDQLVGVISRRDLDIAFHHGFSHAPVKGYMTTRVRTISPQTSLPEVEDLMVTYDIGRLPVLDQGQLVGIVTRTDVLRQLHRRVRQRVSPRQGGEHPQPWGNQARLDRLAQPLQDLLKLAAEQATARGWHLYLVGGGVRDLLLATVDSDGQDAPVMLNDLDLVVDGYHQSAEAGAGMALAEALQALYPAVRLEVHGKFQTAALLWHKDPVLDSLWMDIATARTEFYPYPAANPEVEASSIQQDLYRRDFTINALALRLTQPNAGEMLDFFGGALDLQQRSVRVLHANSFIEDPTRIYRGVRFATRLGFTFEPQTEGYIRHAIASGIYQQVQDSKNGKVIAPALQTRLKAELKYILQADYWRSAIQLLADLDALTCIHPSLRLDRDLWRQLRLMEYWMKRFDQQQFIPHWQMLLEVLLAALEPEVRTVVAQNLQLAADCIDRLANLANAEVMISQRLPQCLRPSQVVELLKAYDLPTLMLVAVRLQQRRQTIRQYLSYWSQVRPLLDGNDLKQLGYKPGKQFKEILAMVLQATLDGEIEGREAAIEFVKNRYPL